MPRARDIGIRIGALPTGPTNSVLDVAGRRARATPPCSATSRTAGRPRHRAHRRHHAAAGRGRLPPPLAAGGAVLNGAGECTGFLTAREWGAVETPVYLTSTMQLGRVYDAACADRARASTPASPTTWSSRSSPSATTPSSTTAAGCRSPPTTCAPPTPRRWPRAARPHPRPRARSAPGPACPASGFKGGIGTSSRVTADGHTVAVLLLTNFGERERLTVAGVPVGRLLPPGARRPAEAGRLVHRGRGHRRPGRRRGCARLARRVGLGLARDRLDRPPRQRRDLPGGLDHRPRLDRDGRPRPAAAGSPAAASTPLFEAVVDATEEAVLNSMLALAHDRRPRRQHQRGPATRRDVLALLEEAGRDRALSATSDHDGRRDRPRRDALPARPRRRAAAVPARGAALPQGRPDLVVRRDLRAAARRVRLRRLPGRRARHRLLGGRRHRRVPARGAVRPGRGDRLAGRARRGATAASACGARRTPASTRCSSPASGRRRSRRSARSTPPTTAGPTTCTGAAARCRLVDLVDYCHYMTPMCVLPPVPAVWGDGLAGGVAAPARDQGAVGADLAAGEPRRPLLAARVGAARRDGAGYDRIDCPAMIVAGLGRRLPQQLLPHGRGAARGAGPAPAARRAVGARRPDDGDARARGSTSTSRWPPGSTAGCAADRRDGATRTACDVFVRGSTRPSPTSTCTRAAGSRDDVAPHPAATSRRARAARARCRRPRHRHRRLDRLRRTPALGAVRRPARGRRPLADLGPRPPARRVVGQPRGPAAGQRRRAGRLALGQALRRLPRRHLRAGHPRHARPGLPRRRARAGRRRSCPGRSTTSWSTSTPAPTSWSPGHTLRLSVAGADWPNTVAPPAPVTLTRPRGIARAAGPRGRRPRGPDLRRRCRALVRERRGCRLGDPRRRAPPGHHGPDPHGVRLRHPVRRARRSRTTAARSASTGGPSSRRHTP